jgi:hypothetical protein
MRLLRLIQILEHEKSRLADTGLEQDAEVELSVEARGPSGYVARVAPLQTVGVVGAAIRLTARPS